MPTLRYVVADVFTDVPLAGNQLAVFTDGRDVDDETMQKLAREIATFPQAALRGDRWSVLNQWSLDLDEARLAEYREGVAAMRSGQALEGAKRFAEGSGRHGA